MKAHFINKLLSQPWHISQARGRMVIGSILSRLRSERPAEDVFGEPLPKMQILDDVAVIPLRGVLMINVPGWLKEWGLNVTDANDIDEELQRALHDPAVSMIVLDSDSPGGWSIAGDKLFDLVEAAGRKKPVFAWCADGGDCCSSAYEAVAPCTAILAGKHALAVGCIGSYLAILDDSEYWKMLGITWEVFRSGDLKGIGEDALSETQRAWLQEMTDAAGATFRRNVAKYRTELPAEEMQGQYYTGAEAARRGFIHGTARDLSGAIAKWKTMLRAYYDSGK